MGRRRPGFTFIEALVVIGLIALLATIAATSLFAVRRKARDQARIADLNTIYRYLGAAGGTSVADYWPYGTPSEEDLSVLTAALAAKYGASFFSQPPRDPRATGGLSGYRYRYDDVSGSIVIYANLENQETTLTLPHSEPTPGGGRGVLVGTGSWAQGWNGTDRYFQVSN